MKRKTLLVSAVVALAAIVVGFVIVVFVLESAIKVGVEAIGPKLTGTKIALSGLHLKLLSGAVGIDGFELGNPEGYSTPHALKVKSIFVQIQPSSLLKSKIVVSKVVIDGVDMNYEQGFPASNLTTIKGNLEASLKKLPGQSGEKKAEPTEGESKPGKKLQVDLLSISNVSVALAVKGLGGRAPLIVPDIKMENVGSGPDGITLTELIGKIFGALIDGALKAVSNVISLSDVGNALGKSATDAASNVKDGAKNAVDGVMNLFK